MIDLHAHILPGLDDGPSREDESLEMCRQAVQDGIQQIVATPHMLDGSYNITKSDVLSKLDSFTPQLHAAGIPLTLLPGGDVHASPEIAANVEQDEVLTVADGKRYILLELPSQTVPTGIQEVVFQLRIAGIVPILSHPERNLAVQRDPNQLIDLAQSGVLFQITAGSLRGRFGRRARKCAARLLEQNLAHVIASDAHSATSRPPRLAAAREIATRIVGPDRATEMVLTNPQKVVAGEVIVPREPMPRRSLFAFRSRTS